MPHAATGLDGVVRRDHARRGCRSRGEHVVLAGGRLHTEAGAEAAASGAARIPEPALRHQSAIAKSAAWVVAKELVVRAAASTWRGNVLCLGNSGTGRQEVMARDAG